jgi:hypothetical protein
MSELVNEQMSEPVEPARLDGGNSLEVVGIITLQSTSTSTSTSASFKRKFKLRSWCFLGLINLWTLHVDVISFLQSTSAALMQEGCKFQAQVQTP